MSKIKTLTKLLISGNYKNVSNRIADNFCKSKLSHIIPDSMMLKLQYRLIVGKKLNLKKPIGFNEKLQWLKLNDRKPEYTIMADKLKVKEYVANKIGRQYVVDNYGAWDSFDTIDFNSLPNAFVLKCNHDSGSVVVCKNKENFDYERARAKLTQGLTNKPFYYGREWPYKDIKPMILAEEFLYDNNVKRSGELENTDGLIDYKFHCFNGEPKFVYLGYANMKDGVKHDYLTYLDLEWKKTPFSRPDHPEIPFDVPKPECLDEMLRITRELSAGIPFVRVDLYVIGNRILFSEMTFTPAGGFSYFYPEEWEIKLGEWIKTDKI